MTSLVRNRETGFAVTHRFGACPPTAAMAWLFCDGFLADRYGELSRIRD